MTPLGQRFSNFSAGIARVFCDSPDKVWSEVALLGAAYQDWAELKDALAVPAGHFLLAQRDWRAGHAVHGAHPHPPV